MMGLRFTPVGVSGNSQILALVQEAYSLALFQIALPDSQDLRLNLYQIDAVMPAGTAGRLRG